MNKPVATKLIFENEKTVDEHQLTHKGEVIFVGTSSQCYMKLQQSQSQSADWAIKHEGWKVEPTGKQMPDPRITVTITENSNRLNNTVRFEYRGKEYRVRKDAIYAHPELTKGQQVDIDSNYAFELE